MIRYTKGNLLNSDAQALVNTVNTMGVMGKGIALQFKEAYPENFRVYKKACDNKELAPGKLLLVRELDLSGERVIINFPTKTQWWLKSKYSYVEDGLKELARVIEEENIQSIAIPPLGCGNGGLKWEKVKALIEKYLTGLEADIIVYEPNEAIKELLQKEGPNKEAKLTPARAMLLYALYQYESLGEASSLFVANKLAYFLQRMGEPLRLKFVASHYGPYSVQVGHVLYALNGVYLHGLEQKKAKAFELLKLNYDKEKEVQQYVDTQLSTEQKSRLKGLTHFMEGFQSAFSLELLATVDYMLQEDAHLEEEQLLERLQEWSARKTKMFKPAYIQVAYEHLAQYSLSTDFRLSS